MKEIPSIFLSVPPCSQTFVLLNFVCLRLCYFFTFWFLLFGFMVFWFSDHWSTVGVAALVFYSISCFSSVLELFHRITQDHTVAEVGRGTSRDDPPAVYCLTATVPAGWSSSGASSHLSLTLSWSSVGSCHGATHGVLLSLFPSWYWSWSWLLVSFQTTELGQPFLKWTGVMWVVVTQGTHIQ